MATYAATSQIFVTTGNGVRGPGKVDYYRKFEVCFHPAALIWLLRLDVMPPLLLTAVVCD